MVVYSRWSFNEGGRLGRFDCIKKLTEKNSKVPDIFSHRRYKVHVLSNLEVVGYNHYPYIDEKIVIIINRLL